MVQKKSEDKSFVIYKKEELYDQLFNSLEGPEELRIGDMSPEREEKLKKILDYLYEKPGADTPEDREYWAEILEKVEAEKRAKEENGG